MVIAELDAAGLRESTLEALGEGRVLADGLHTSLGLVLAGSSLEKALEQAICWDADEIYLLENPLLEPYITGLWVDALEPLFSRVNPSAALCAATPNGQDLAAGLAARLRWELVSGCVWVKTCPDGSLRFIRPVHRGQAQETLSISPGTPCLATLLPGSIGVAAPQHTRQPDVINVNIEITETSTGVHFVGIIPGDLRKMDLREADIVVSGGRGASSPESWKLIENLADALQAPVGGSRLALDSGCIPLERMIGQTGSDISPRLYFAAGISGVLHHLGGVHTRHLIAINSDKSAPIFRQSTLGILGDLNSDSAPAD